MKTLTKKKRTIVLLKRNAFSQQKSKKQTNEQNVKRQMIKEILRTIQMMVNGNSKLTMTYDVVTMRINHMQ